MAAEILRSRQDLGENLHGNLTSQRDSRRVFGRRDFEILAEISARSHRDLGQNFAGVLLKQVNTTPHRFELAAPPRVFLDRTIQGPKTSKPTLVKGGATSVLTAGRSALC